MVPKYPTKWRQSLKAAGRQKEIRIYEKTQTSKSELGKGEENLLVPHPRKKGARGGDGEGKEVAPLLVGKV